MHYYLSVTVDIDPDDATIVSDRSTLKWSALDILPSLRKGVADFNGTLTWFVRADDQIAALCGTYHYLLEKYRDFWETSAESGDEIALHPHLCRYDIASNTWLPIYDPVLCCAQLNRIHGELENVGYNFKSIRIGEAFNSNQLMKCIDDLGYLVDSTGIAGRRRDDSERYFDWSPTTNSPYHPSTSDYRISADQRLRVLEVPMTTAKFLADYDNEPKLRYMSLTYRPEIFASGLKQFFSERSDVTARSLVFIVHPGELFCDGMPNSTHGLYSFNVEAVRSNLDFVLNNIIRNGDSFSFLNISGFAQTFS